MFFKTTNNKLRTKYDGIKIRKLYKKTGFILLYDNEQIDLRENKTQADRDEIFAECQGMNMN